MSCGFSPGLPAGLPAGGFVGTSAPTHKSNSSWQANRPTAPGTSWTPQAKPAPRASEQLRSHFSVIGAREERGVRVPSFGKSCICMLVYKLSIGLEVEPLVPPSDPAKTASCIYVAYRGCSRNQICVLRHLCRPGPSPPTSQWLLTDGTEAMFFFFPV